MSKVRNIVLTGEWVNLNTVLSVPIGTNLQLQNQSTGVIYVQESDTEPSSKQEGFFLSYAGNGDSVANINTPTLSVWVIGGGVLAVQEVNL